MILHGIHHKVVYCSTIGARLQGISCLSWSSPFWCHKWNGDRLYALCSIGRGKDSTVYMVGPQTLH